MMITIDYPIVTIILIVIFLDFYYLIVDIVTRRKSRAHKCLETFCLVQL